MSVPYWAKYPERNDQEGLPSENESLWTANKKIALGILVIFVSLLVWVINREEPSSQPSPFENMANEYENGEFAYDEAYIGGSGSGTGPPAGHLKENASRVSSPRLVMELRRLVRAGRSMDALRQNDNLTLLRRCRDGMQKLQKETQVVMLKAGPRIDHCPWLGAESGFAGLFTQAARRV